MFGTTEFDLPQTLRIEDAAGAPPETGEAEEHRQRTPREEAMARIAAHYEETQRANEIAYGEQLAREAAERAPQEPEVAEEPVVAEPVETTAPEPVAAPPEPRAPVPQVQAAPPPAPAQAPPQPQLRVVNVQGQQFQVTEEQYAQLASMGAVANLALRQHATQQQPAPAPVQQQPPQFQQPQLHAQMDRERATAILNRLSYGNPDDGVAAIQDLATDIAQRLQAQQPQIDPGLIRQEATRDALQHLQLQHDLGVLAQEYPSIWNSRALSLGAAAELGVIRQRDTMLGAQRPSIEQYREACNNLMAQLPQQQSQSGANGGTHPAIQAAPSATRLERKRAAPRNPAAASSLVAPLGEAERSAPTSKEIINQMRVQRGQLPL